MQSTVLPSSIVRILVVLSFEFEDSFDLSLPFLDELGGASLEDKNAIYKIAILKSRQLELC